MAIANWRVEWCSLCLCLAQTTAKASATASNSSLRSGGDTLRSLRGSMVQMVHRLLSDHAASGSNSHGKYNPCHNPESFLGVGNRECLNEHMATCVFLLFVIIVASVVFDHFISFIEHRIHCPQLAKIVNRVFEELTVLGFISMIIFFLNNSGSLQALTLDVTGLTSTEKLHFYEFFHYLVFLTMVFFILIILWLLFTGSVVPRLVWKLASRNRSSGSDQDSSEVDSVVVPRLVWKLASRNRSSGSDQDSSEVDSVDRSGTCSSLNSALGRQPQYDRHNLTPAQDASDPRKAQQEEFMSLGLGRMSIASSYCESDSDSDGDLGSARSNLSSLARHASGMTLVEGTRAYSKLMARYEKESSTFWFLCNLKRQWKLWQNLEFIAYKICQNRSGYIYKNPLEMERLFGVSRYKRTDFDRYHVLCMRNLLFHIAHLRYSAFVILLVIVLLPALVPADFEAWVFMSVGVVLLVINLMVFFKVWSILRGIVRDRLQVVTERDVRLKLHEKQSRQQRREQRRKKLRIGGGKDEHENDKNLDGKSSTRHRFRSAVTAVRAIVRLQMSALCHSQLHYHDHRFWFKSPLFLLRVFQFATIGQSFYLVWLVLVEVQDVRYDAFPALKLAVMFGFPIIVLFVITPLTLPSLVLVMSLTGIFVEMNDPHAHRQHESMRHRLTRCLCPSRLNPDEDHEVVVRDRIRRLRAGYLRDRHALTHDKELSIAPTSSTGPSGNSSTADPSSTGARKPSIQAAGEKEGVYMRMFHQESPLPSPISNSTNKSPYRDGYYVRDRSSLSGPESSPAGSKGKLASSPPQTCYVAMKDSNGNVAVSR